MCKLGLYNNSIVTGSTPIYAYTGKIVSSTVLVVLNNDTVKSPANTAVTLTACLYDDNGNIIGSNTGITLNVVGLKSGLTATFNRENLNYNIDYTPTVAGIYAVKGTVPTSIATNVSGYKYGTLVTGITTLDVNLIVNNTKPAVNDMIQYTVTVKNTGEYTANSISVEDILDNSKLEYVSCSPSGAYNPDTGIWTVVNLASNQESSLNIIANVKSTGEISNTLTVKSTQIMDDITKNVLIVASKKTLDTSDIQTKILNNSYGNATVKITVPVDVTGNITINVNGKNYTEKIENGEVTIKLSDVTPGNYNATVIYSGDDNYNPISTLIDLKIVKGNINSSAIKTEILNNTLGNTTVKVSVPEGITGNITINVNGKDYNGTIANGSAIIKLPTVPVGNHTMTIIYSGDNNYNPSKAYEDLEVVREKLKPDDMKVEILNNIVGKVEVKVTLPKNVSGNVTIKIGSETYNGTLENGSVIIDIPNLSTGNYTMNITYNGDKNYEPISKEVNLTVESSPLIVVKMPVYCEDIFYGSTETISVYLSKDVYGLLTVDVNGIIQETSVGTYWIMSADTGNWRYDFYFKDLEAGIYDVTVTYGGNSHYASVINTTSFEVKKTNLNPDDIKIDVINKTPGNVTLNITVPKDVTGNIAVTIGNDTYPGTIENGSAIIKLPTAPIGNSTINITYSGDGNYEPTTKQENITVDKYHLNVDDIKTEVLNNTCGNTTVKITVPENVTGNITIKINNKTYNGTITNGSAIISLPDVGAGNHTMIINYSGDDNYNPISKEENLEIAKKTLSPADIKVTIENNTYGNTTVKVTVSKDATGNITIAIGNKTYNAPIANGTAIVSLYDVPVGQYNMTITYNGDNNYNSTSIEESISIEKATINPDDIKLIVDKDSNGNTVITIIGPEELNGNITLEIDGKNYTVEVIKGIGSITIPNLPDGEYNRIITFNGNNNFNGFVKNITIEIKSDNTTDNNVSTESSISNKENITKIANANSLENIKTANPIALLILALLAIPLKRRKDD